MARRTPGVRPTSLYILLGVAAVAALIADHPANWGAGSPLVRHAEWDGAGLADLLSPLFLFLLGAALPLSRRDHTWPAIAAASIVLIAAGLLVSGYPDFDAASWRIPGVLQRAGVCFLAAAVAFRLTAGDDRRRTAILASAAAFLAIVYWLIMAHVPVPGGSAGNLSPGRTLAAWLDDAVLAGHLAAPHQDPDGILSTLSSIATILSGVVAGLAVVAGAARMRNAAQLATGGLACGVGAWLWSSMVPINRTLWSSSFAVLGAGAGLLVMAAWVAFGGNGPAPKPRARRR